jgi:ABC-type amino acid transport substrate-binding protein
MSIFYIIGLIILIFIGTFKILKKKYMSGIILILTGIFTYGILKKTSNKEIIQICCSPDYKPFCYLKNGHVIGIDKEIIEKIGEKLQKKIDIKIVNFCLLFEEIKQNKSSIAMGGLSINEERKAYLNFSIPYLSSTGACGFLTKKDIILNKDFEGVIGIQMGTNSFKEIVKNKFPKAKIIEIDDFMVLLESFKNNIDNIHVIVGDTIVLIDFLENKKNDTNEYKIYKTNIPNILGTGFLLSKEVDVNKFNSVLNEVINTNEKLKIIKEKIKKIEDLE